MPAILQILIVFAAMLALNRLKVPLGLALVIGGAGLGLWSGRAPADVLGDLGRAVQSSELWLFVLITALIVEFGRYMTEDANAAAIVRAVRRWGGRHGVAWSLMALPSVIGLIPMPAGALFSAPLVDQANEGAPRTPEWKTAVNYWFRHTWEYWWPLYPGIIVAMSVFKMLETWQFIAAEILYTPAAMLAGYFLLVRPHMEALAGPPPPAGPRDRRPLILMLPLAVVVAASVLLPFALQALFPRTDPQIRRMQAMLAGLAVGLAMILWDERHLPRVRVFRDVLKAKSRNVLLTVAGVLVFKSLLDASGLLPVASQDLLRWHVPAVCAVAGLPLLAGLVTGLTIGFTGTAFPLVVGLMSATGSGLTPMATLVLAFGFGYAGTMLSPIHLCLVVTRDYFEAPLLGVYRLVVPCMASVLVVSVLLYSIFHALGW